MDIPVDVYVTCSEGLLGFLDGILLDPVTNEVTHLVVEDDKLGGIKRLVPICEIVKSTFRSILLRCSACEFSELESFSGRECFSIPEANELANRSPKQIELKFDSQVFALDGKVGELDELLIAPDNHHISDLVVRIGYYWGYKDVAIPLAEVAQFKDNSVYVKLSKSAIASLPEIPDQLELENSQTLRTS